MTTPKRRRRQARGSSSAQPLSPALPPAQRAALTPKPKVPRSTPVPARDPPRAAGDWKATLRLVEELRADRSAPVDEFGSEELPLRPPQVPLSTFRYQTLIALMLSSQTKDQMVGQAMRKLQTSPALEGGLCATGVAAAKEDTIRELIYGVGFHNRKASYIKRATALIVEQHSGNVPSTMKGLLALPGVGPKMSLIVLNAAFGKVVGVSIDTHLHRMLPQLGWTKVRDLVYRGHFVRILLTI